MTISANLADGRVLNFPDGTDPQVIQNTVKKMTVQQPPGVEAQSETIETPVQPNRADKLIELYQSGKLSGKQLEAAEELIKRGSLKIPTEAPKDEPGILDYIMGTGEVLGTMATGTAADITAGFAGAAAEAGILPGEGPETIKRVKEAMTYQPRTEAAKRIGAGIGEAIGPVAETIAGGVQGVSDIAYESGGPVAGTAVKTAISAIPELMGLKGTKMAKKRALSHLFKDKDISSLYDDVGRLMPEIKKSITDSGIDMDEIEDIIPESIVERDIGATAEEISKAAKAVVSPEKKALKIAEKFKPSKEILDAAEEIGVSDLMLASHSSQNPVATAIEQGLKEIPGSQLKVRERALISRLGEKADDLITEFGGKKDKSELSDAFRSKSKDVIDNLNVSSEHAYTTLNEIIPKKSDIYAPNIVKHLYSRAEELGGFKNLPAVEKKMLSDLEPKSKPTYGLLDYYRKQIGAGFKKNKGLFKDSSEGDLKQLYKVLAEDQKRVAYEVGDATGKLYEMANGLVVTRKTIEDQLIKTMGKELTGSIADKARLAILGLQKGSTKQFDELVQNIPEQLGKDLRKSAIVSSLNDAFVQGSRAERSLNIPGFDDFMVGLSRHPSAKNRLKTEIGADAVKRLDTLHLVVGGIRKAQKDAISTGRLATVPGLFDEVDNIATRVYGKTKTVASKLPGAKVVGVVGDVIDAKKTARSEAADALLTSNRFRKVLNQKAAGRLEATAKLEEAEKIVEQLKEYQAWKKTLNQKDKKDLAAVGVMGYLTGKTMEEESE